jgi:hypothetical protein
LKGPCRELLQKFFQMRRSGENPPGQPTGGHCRGREGQHE